MLNDEFKIGDSIWIPCEVKEGNFSNERFVHIPFSSGSWDGFVDVTALMDAPETGETYVLGSIMEIIESEILATVPGHAINASPVKASIEKVRPVDSVPS